MGSGADRAAVAEAAQPRPQRQRPRHRGRDPSTARRPAAPGRPRHPGPRGAQPPLAPRPGRVIPPRPAPSAQRHAARAAADVKADLVTGLVIPLVHDLITLTGMRRADAPALIALSDQTTGALLYSPADHGTAQQAWTALDELTTTAQVRPGSLPGRSAAAMAATGMTAQRVHKAQTTIANGLPTAIPATAR